MSKQAAFDPTAASDLRFKRLLEHLAHCTTLPSPPTVAARIIELAQNPEIDLGDVVDVVTMDPALATKILRIVNSPLHGLRRRAQNLRQAIALLGLESTLTLALGFSLVNGLQDRKAGKFDYVYFWRRSVAAACCARMLGDHIGAGNLESLFLAALLQDIGVLAIDRIEPGFYDSLEKPVTHEKIRCLEVDTFGVDHAEVGARMLMSWSLPEWLCDAVANSHQPKPGVDSFDRFACVALGALMADQGWQDQRQEGVADLRPLADEWLAIDAAAYWQLVELAEAATRETAQVFDIDLSDWMMGDLLQEQAREVLVMRNLRASQDLADYKKSTEGLKQKAESLEEQSRHDPLTGLYNRAHLDQVAAEEFGHATTLGTPLTLVFVDVDHFKRVNDRFGHLVGDDVLRDAAAVMQTVTRQGDILARYGGEEFVVVMPGTGREGAEKLSTRLLKAFRNNRVRIGPQSEIKVTISIGAACMDSAHPYADIQALLKTADDALYRAKRGGRDRAEIVG